MSMRIQIFETLMIFHERLTEEEYERKIREYEDILKSLPAVRIDTDRLRNKKLAYKIRGCTRGWYVLFTYKSTEDLVNHKLDLILRRDDDVIKFLSMSHGEEFRFEGTDLLDDEEANPESEQDEPAKKSKQPVDVFDLIFGLEEVI